MTLLNMEIHLKVCLSTILIATSIPSDNKGPTAAMSDAMANVFHKICYSRCCQIVFAILNIFSLFKSQVAVKLIKDFLSFKKQVL